MSTRRSPQLVPVTTPDAVGSRCQPAPAVVRAVTATKHELGLSRTAQQWKFGLLVRKNYYQCARSEVLALLPRWRAAWTRWLSVVISEAAAAKHSFSMCATEHPFQIQNLSIFHATQGTGTSEATAKDLRSHQFPRSCCNCTVTRLASRMCGARFLKS